MIFDTLIDAINNKSNPTVVGLDPNLACFPKNLLAKYSDYSNQFQAAGEAILEFNKNILDAIHDIVPAVKPQLAYYEQYGPAGIAAFQATTAYAKQLGLLVITDGKRNDIGSTAGAYAHAYLGEATLPNGSQANWQHSDFLTVNPYLGSDGIKPFLKQCDTFQRGIFLLLKTSNPSSSELQDKTLEDGGTLCDALANQIHHWSTSLGIGEAGFGPIGVVVGATHPEHAKQLREQLPHSFFLVPGYGAQGGDVNDVRPCFKDDGTGAIINSSRGIIYAYQKEAFKCDDKDYAKAAREAALAMREDLSSI